MLYLIFLGSPSQPGSLSNMRESILRTQVDKNVKVFNTGDEFFMHVTPKSQHLHTAEIV